MTPPGSPSWPRGKRSSIQPCSSSKASAWRNHRPRHLVAPDPHQQHLSTGPSLALPSRTPPAPHGLIPDVQASTQAILEVVVGRSPCRCHIANALWESTILRTVSSMTRVCMTKVWRRAGLPHQCGGGEALTKRHGPRNHLMGKGEKLAAECPQPGEALLRDGSTHSRRRTAREYLSNARRIYLTRCPISALRLPYHDDLKADSWYALRRHDH